MTTIRPGWNQLDRRHKLIPRAYCVNPYAFGVRADAAFHVPPRGDAVCAAIARVQHELALRWHAAGLDGCGSQAARDFGFSSSTFSRTLLGERWMGERVMAAVVYRLLDVDR
jgi:hypothetical protein